MNVPKLLKTLPIQWHIPVLNFEYPPPPPGLFVVVDTIKRNVKIILLAVCLHMPHDLSLDFLWSLGELKKRKKEPKEEEPPPGKKDKKDGKKGKKDVSPSQFKLCHTLTKN